MKKLLLTVLLGTAGIPIAIKSQTNPANEHQRQQEKKQPKFGLKAGYQFSKISGSPRDIYSKSKNGFIVGGFYSPIVKTGFGFRTEIIFSRTRYASRNDLVKDEVVSDYIYLPQLSTFTIGKFLQFQAGTQMGILLSASRENKTMPDSSKSLIDLMNRVDFGFAFGAEVYPIKRLLLGARFNVSFRNIYKGAMAGAGGYPIPLNDNTLKTRTGVAQFFVGYKF